jgi:hypothetical protein
VEAAARDAGVNLAFLGANNLWWHARLLASPGAADPDRQVVWRDTVGDPTPHRQSQNYTLLWSQWPEHRDGAAVLGQSHAGIGVHGGYQLMAAPPWLLAGTGLRPGTSSGGGSVLPIAVGNEADGFNPGGSNPPDLTVVAAGVLRGARGPVTVSADYYSAPAGAGVFAAGSTDWSCGLDGECLDQDVPAATVSALRALTRNIVLGFTHPRAGLARPSVLSVPPSTAQLLRHLSPGAIGTYGGSESSEEAGSGHTRSVP